VHPCAQRRPNARIGLKLSAHHEAIVARESSRSVVSVIICSLAANAHRTDTYLGRSDDEVNSPRCPGTESEVNDDLLAKVCEAVVACHRGAPRGRACVDDGDGALRGSHRGKVPVGSYFGVQYLGKGEERAASFGGVLWVVLLRFPARGECPRDVRRDGVVPLHTSKGGEQRRGVQAHGPRAVGCGNVKHGGISRESPALG